jgi:AraC-like DNA-binding protein
MIEGSRLAILAPPYEVLNPIDTKWEPPPGTNGVAIVWHVTSHAIISGEFEWIRNRPRGIACALVLPPAIEIPRIASFLSRLSDLEPNAVLPSGRLVTPRGLKTALSGGSQNLPRAVSAYLTRHRIVTSTQVRSEVFRIFQLAPNTATVSRLCRQMFLSRRTLGRHFGHHRLPVPSHWLQFARLLHVLMRSQTERVALFRLAVAAGYPDGFTFSNQVKRLTGVRPTEARALIGFEWLIEAWLAREARRRDQAVEPIDDPPAE